MAATLLLVHQNGKSRNLKLNFCWLGFFLPIAWAVSEGLWRPFAFSLMGCIFLARAPELARDVGVPAISVLGISYFVIMIVFGVYGKKWVAADMLANGYREVNRKKA